MAELPVPVRDPEEVRRVTEAVLARPEFLEARPTWWQELQRLIGDLIGRLVDLVGGGGRGSVIGSVVLVALALVGAFVVLRFSRTMRRDPSLAVAVEGGVGRTPAQWLSDAQSHEAAGQWRHAVRCRYRALLAELAAAGLLEEVPGTTAGEYLSQVRRDVPTADGRFTAATRLFEAAWYGHASLDQADVRAFAAAATDVLRAAGVRGHARISA